MLVQLHLASLDGHEHTQFRAIKWLLPDCKVSVLTRQGFGLSGKIDELNILEVFPANLRRPKNPQASVTGFVDALARTIQTLQAGQSDLLLVPSAGPDTIVPLVHHFESEAAGEGPPAKLRILSDDILAGFDAAFLARLRQVCSTGRMTLHTETAELRSRLANHYDLPVSGPFNLPCTILPGDPDIQTQTGPGAEIRIGVLGRQRSEKGSYRIPGILHHLRDVAGEFHEQLNICIVYQAVRTKRLRRFVLELKTRMNARRNRQVRIEFLNSGMSEDQFRQMVLAMDILLLPYDTHRYRYSGSGIILDGVLSLKPIVYSEGMAMQELLSHGNAEAATTDREFAQKLLKIVTAYPRYKQSAIDASEHLQALLAESAKTLTGK